MKLKRIYNESDSDMLAKISGLHYFFKKHLEEFKDYDPELNSAYLVNWKTALDELAKHALTGEQEETVFENGLLTGEAAKTLDKCRAKYKDVKYFAGKAFPKNKEIMMEFGERQYNKVSQSPKLMVPFMQTLHGVATKYKDQLIDKNYTQSAIDEIETLAQELSLNHQAQQLKTKERPTQTRKRVQANNTFYSFGQNVALAAKVIFRDNEVVRKEFLLAQKHHPKQTKTWFTLGISGTRKIALPKLLKKFTLTLTNQSTETVTYWQANNIHHIPLQKDDLTPGEVVTINQQDPPQKFLLVQNTSTKPVRLMLVKEKKE